MKRKVIYVADDGKEFEYEIDCRAHERKCEVEAFGDHLRLWDEDMKPLDPAEEDALEDAYYIYADTPEAREWIDAELSIYDELGWATVYAGYLNDNWVDLEDLYDMVLKTIAAMVSNNNSKMED